MSQPVVVAQIAKDIGAHAGPRKLANVAIAYESSVVRRLGYLLELYAIASKQVLASLRINGPA